jgi:hypothetical protein
MTPQEQAQAVMKACGANRGNPIRAALTRLIGAAAIRAAVDLVLPEPPARAAFLPSEYELAAMEDERLLVREELLAIAAELEGPTDD